MAKLKLTPQIVALLGPIGGVNINPNRQNPVIGKRPSETKRTPAQRKVRVNFRSVDRAYTRLPEDLKNLWRTAAKSRRWTGYWLWMHINIPRGLAGLPLLVTPP